MTVDKINNTFYEETDIRLGNSSQLKLFPLLRDSATQDKFLNVFRSYVINDTTLNDSLYFSTYDVNNDDWWDNIAFREYGDSKLWWVIAMFNDVVNPFEELEPGKQIKILKRDFLYQLLQEIEEIQRL